MLDMQELNLVELSIKATPIFALCMLVCSGWYLYVFKKEKSDFFQTTIFILLAVSAGSLLITVSQYALATFPASNFRYFASILLIPFGVINLFAIPLVTAVWLVTVVSGLKSRRSENGFRIFAVASLVVAILSTYLIPLRADLSTLKKAYESEFGTEVKTPFRSTEMYSFQTDSIQEARKHIQENIKKFSFQVAWFDTLPDTLTPPITLDYFDINLSATFQHSSGGTVKVSQNRALTTEPVQNCDGPSNLNCEVVGSLDGYPVINKRGYTNEKYINYYLHYTDIREVSVYFHRTSMQDHDWVINLLKSMKPVL